ncbi:unnamed protein product [Vitrella brassicaformis CCMP3155]|uniref:Uncharacterized protein n=1 Tax=Vitrella brassicaformis (strain CCMP3155) TaxID=1169540 RepID=A0A0G4EW31_VITBC|nr:unnamed protein product [Vitrella brassicaformis CCMP3155]|eukprot:CEM02652.1 unnamed protein product [Vitrella brassicaformis CCMP3155]
MTPLPHLPFIAPSGPTKRRHSGPSRVHAHAGDSEKRRARLLRRLPFAPASDASDSSLKGMATTATEEEVVAAAPPAASSLVPTTEGTRLTLYAERKGSLAFEENEGERSLREYLSLPAEEYSVLDPQAITRINATAFIYTMQPLTFLSLKVAPEMLAIVDVDASVPSSLIRVVDGRIGMKGSEALSAGMLSSAQRALNSVTIRSSNLSTISADRVKCKRTGKENPIVNCETRLEVSFTISNSSLVPPEVVLRAGTWCLQKTLNRLVPAFLGRLRADYRLWAVGDDSRTPPAVSGGMGGME